MKRPVLVAKEKKGVCTFTLCGIGMARRLLMYSYVHGNKVRG
jgi:hypothetical protein